MGGFTGLFDRPDPTVASLTKNPRLRPGINATIGDWSAARSATQGGLGDYIRNYLSGNADATKAATQETAPISSFYNGNMASQLAALRAGRTSAVNNAADVGVQQALRSVDQSRVGEQGGGGSYDRRLAIGAVTPIRTQAALDNANQQRADLDYLTGNQIALTGARTGIADKLAARSLTPGQASFSALGSETGGMSPIIGNDQANTYYGIQQKPGLLDRMQQETQFLQGLQSIMKNQYGTASEAVGGWAGMGGSGGGGGGGMSSMMGGMGGMGMRRGGMVGYNYVDHILDYTGGGGVNGPGTGTSDSIPARLSNGEFVVPARAVRLPGVLPLLEKIRRMGGEGPSTDANAHMAGGGLLYADSFGGLGSAALARDAFNESVVGGQVQQIQQQGQFDATRSDQNAKSQADIDKYILEMKQRREANAAGGGSGYQPMSLNAYSDSPSAGIDTEPNFARGGLVYRAMRPSPGVNYNYRPASIPYGDRARASADIRSGEFARANPEPGIVKFARGGMVRGYAEGGSVDDDNQDSAALLHQLAVKAAREMLIAPSGRTLPQQRLQFEQDQATQSNARADRTLGDNEAYQNWQMQQPPPAVAAANERKHGLVLQLANQAAQNGEDVSGFDLDPVEKTILGKISDSAAESKNTLFAHAKNLSDLMNEQKMIDEAEPRLKEIQSQNSRGLVHEFLTPTQKDAYKNASDQLAQNADRKTALARILAPYQKDRDTLVTYNPMQDGYEPAVRPAPLRNSRAVPVSIPNQGFESGDAQIGTTPAATAMRSGQYQPKMSPAYYARVTQLVGSGMDLPRAKTQAMAEMQGAR